MHLGFSLCATAGFLTYFFASGIVPELFNGENSITKFIFTCFEMALYTVAVVWAAMHLAISN